MNKLQAVIISILVSIVTLQSANPNPDVPATWIGSWATGYFKGIKAVSKNDKELRSEDYSFYATSNIGIANWRSMQKLAAFRKSMSWEDENTVINMVIEDVVDKRETIHADYFFEEKRGVLKFYKNNSSNYYKQIHLKNPTKECFQRIFAVEKYVNENSILNVLSFDSDLKNAFSQSKLTTCVVPTLAGFLTGGEAAALGYIVATLSPIPIVGVGIAGFGLGALVANKISERDQCRARYLKEYLRKIDPIKYD